MKAVFDTLFAAKKELCQHYAGNLMFCGGER
jgi:hypothetical protein